jgi:RND family efflux transporter MFP subunit
LSPKVSAPLGLLGLGVAIAILLIATRPMAERSPDSAPAPLVRAMTVRPEPVRLTVDAYGTVVPRTESDMVVQIAGEVVWVSPSLVPGGFFSEGEELVRIDPSDAEVTLESARASVARNESEASRARKERDRQQRLAKQSVASQQRIDDVESAYRQAAALLREARAQLRRAERDLARTTLSAPFDGRVRSEQVDVGQFVNRGTAIATLYAIDFAEVRLPIPDRDLAFLDLSLAWNDPARELETGPDVVLRAEFAGEARTWRGRIVRTEGELDPKSRMVHVVARVDDPYGREADEPSAPLAVGLFVEAEISGRRLDRAFVVPRTALRDGDRVLVIDDESRLRYRAVDVVRLDAESVRGSHPARRSGPRSSPPSRRRPHRYGTRRARAHRRRRCGWCGRARPTSTAARPRCPACPSGPGTS